MTEWAWVTLNLGQHHYDPFSLTTDKNLSGLPAFSQSLANNPEKEALSCKMCSQWYCIALPEKPFNLLNSHYHYLCRRGFVIWGLRCNKGSTNQALSQYHQLCVFRSNVFELQGQNELIRKQREGLTTVSWFSGWWIAINSLPVNTFPIQPWIRNKSRLHIMLSRSVISNLV